VSSTPVNHRKSATSARERRSSRGRRPGLAEASAGYRSFYETVDRQRVYTPWNRAEAHPDFPVLKRFVDEYGLHTKRCLEIGSSKGIFQDLVPDYTGIDVAASLRPHYHKPYFTCRKEGTLPLPDDSFDAVWSLHTHEHIPDLQQALSELVRVLKPGGFAMFFPAWQCRSWAAEGYSVRPYSDFGLRGKLIKASIPLRNFVLWRGLTLLPKRLVRHALFVCGIRPATIAYRRIRANYEVLWTSDSDACNSLDPHDAIIWFESHGMSVLNHPLHARALFVRTGPLVLQKAA